MINIARIVLWQKGNLNTWLFVALSTVQVSRCEIHYRFNLTLLRISQVHLNFRDDYILLNLSCMKFITKSTAIEIRSRLSTQLTPLNRLLPSGQKIHYYDTDFFEFLVNFMEF